MNIRLLLAALLIGPACALAQGDDAPEGWHTVLISSRKPPTRYTAVKLDGRAAIHAEAHASASILAQDEALDLFATPLVRWSWKVPRLIPDADNSVASKEDAPARLVFAFDGDSARLSLSERALISASHSFSTYPLPYATLMYVWSNSAPVGSVIANPRTQRVQMIVVSSGAAGLGQWQNLQRNVREDFRRVFGEEPGKLLAWGLMTDTDNTKADAEAWYGPVSFNPAAR